VNADQIISENHILGTNLFTYCLNNPINMIDIDGREAITLTALGLYALGMLVTGMYGFTVMSTPQARGVFNSVFKEISTNISHGFQFLGGITIGAISLASSKANSIAKSLGNSFASTINAPKYRSPR
jgi:hypothetical protein